MTFRISTQKIIIKNTITGFLLILTTVMLLVRDLAGVGVNKYAFLLLISIALIINNKNRCYELVSYYIPLSAGLPGSYIFSVALLVVIARSQNKIKADIVSMSLCLMCLVIELISAFHDINFTIIDYIIFVGPFLLTFYFVFDKDNSYDYYSIAKMFILGFCVAIIDTVGQFLNYFSIMDFLTVGVRLGSLSDVIYNYKVDGMMLVYNANTLGLFCASTALMCFLLTQKLRKRWTVPFGIFFLVIGIMTQSRTFVLVLLIGVLLYILLGNNESQALAKKLTIFILSVGALAFIVSKYVPIYYKNLMDRFQESDISNGRIGITSQYWHGFFDNPERIPFGVGLQHYQEIYGINMSAHIGLQEVMVSWGIVGLIVVLCLFIRMFKTFNYSKMADYDMAIPLIVLLFGLQTGQLFSNTMAYMSIIAMCAFAKIGRNYEMHRRIGLKD